jgi:cache 3/cache 2 fusion protein
MHKHNFIAQILMLACFIILIPSLGTAQTGDVKAAMATLKAETEKLGTPKVQGSDLYFGTTKVDKSTVKAVVSKHDMKNKNGAVTLFVKTGDQYVRVLTTVKTEEGKRAVGTPLDANNPAIAKLNNGEAYYGEATVFGKTYDAGYEPIKDASGTVIGAYFVGFAK